MQHRPARIKKISLAFCVGAFMLTSLLAVSLLSDGGMGSQKTGVSFDTYRDQLSEISENYERENRVVVFSARALEDKNCIASASGYGDMHVFQYATREEAQEALAYYSSLRYVESAMLDVAVKTQEDVSDADGEIVVLDHLTWGAELLGVDKYQAAIEQKYGDLESLPDVYVAVLDTGIDTDNEFLQGRIAYEYGKSFYRSELYKSGESEYEFEDDHMHGTHVAGTIVDLTPDNVKIIPVKVIGASGTGDVSDVMLGMQYLIDLKEKEGINIVAVNMSIAADSSGNESTAVFDRAYEKNIMSVVAAGNDSYYAEEYFPANCRSAITVSALSQNVIYENFPFVSYYSNYGSNVDLCLPGTNVLSCVPDGYDYSENYVFSTTGGTYAYLSGTSMATPHASALVALFATYMGEHFDAAEVEKALKQNAYDLGSTGRDDLFGYGVPSMELALAEKTLTAKPALSHGEVGASYHFADTISVTIENRNPVCNGMTYEIYYTLDGSYPTLCGNHSVYGGGIPIGDSTHLSFVIYLFDGDGFVRGHSALYEVEYFKGEEEDKNTRGVGFEINENGILTRYTSGLQDVVIPATVNGKRVRELGNNLFFGLNVRSITCEADISLGNKTSSKLEYPIRYCPNLQSVTLGASDATYAVSHCFGLKELVLLNATAIANAMFPSFTLGYSYLGSYTAYGCSALERVVAYRAKSVGSYAFNYVKTLKELVLPEVNSIFSCAFIECTGLTAVELPSAMYIYESAFMDCRNLRTVRSPKLTRIESYAFANCISLTDIQTETVTKYGEGALYNCVGLTALDTHAAQTIANSAFEKCSGLTWLDLSGVTSIGINPMPYCTNLKAVYCGSNSYLINKSTSWAEWSWRYGDLQYLVVDYTYANRGGLLSGKFYDRKIIGDKYRVYTQTPLFTAIFQDENGNEIAKRYHVNADPLNSPRGEAYEEYQVNYVSWQSVNTGESFNCGELFYLTADDTFILTAYNVYYSADAERAKTSYSGLYGQLTGECAAEGDPVCAAIDAACTVGGGLQNGAPDRASVLKNVNGILGGAVCDLLDGLLRETDSEAVKEIVAAVKAEVLNACDSGAALAELEGVVEDALQRIAEQRETDEEAAVAAARAAAKEALRVQTKHVYEGLSAERKSVADEMYRQYEAAIDAADVAEYEGIVRACQRAFAVQGGSWAIDDLVNGSEEEQVLAIASAAKAEIRALADADLTEEELQSAVDGVVAQAKADIEEYLASKKEPDEPDDPNEGEDPPVVDPDDPDEGEDPPVVDPDDPNEGEDPPVVDPDDPDEGEDPPVVEPDDSDDRPDGPVEPVWVWVFVGVGVTVIAIVAVVAILVVRKKRGSR